jgi:hypothetical protein
MIALGRALIQVVSFDSTSDSFISAANAGQRGLTRNGSPIAPCRNATTWESRSSIAFSNQLPLDAGSRRAGDNVQVSLGALVVPADKRNSRN